MEKKTKEIILIVIMIPVLFYVFYANFISPSKKKAPPPPKRGEQVETVSPEAPTKSAGAKAKEKEKETTDELPPLDEKLVQMQNNIDEAPWGRDPFSPAPTPVEEGYEEGDWKEFKLSGVLPGPGGGAAMLNGELIGVGEMYRGYRLKEVSDTQIILEKEGQSYILRMPEE
jgi:hypothetical protein